MLPPIAQGLVPFSQLAHFAPATVADDPDVSEVLRCYAEERGFSASPQGDEGGAPALPLLAGGLLVATDAARARVLGGFPDGDAAAEAGLPHGHSAAAAAPANAGRLLLLDLRLCRTLSARGVGHRGKQRPRR